MTPVAWCSDSQFPWELIPLKHEKAEHGFATSHTECQLIRHAVARSCAPPLTFLEAAITEP
jgi:hypothetical protein